MTTKFTKQCQGSKNKLNEFQALRKPEQSLTEFFRNSPLYGVVLEIPRDQSRSRVDAF